MTSMPQGYIVPLGVLSDATVTVAVFGVTIYVITNLFEVLWWNHKDAEY